MSRTLYLVDGHAQFFRAYHAIRTPMTSPVTKEPTNMTFGFVGMMLKLLRGEGKMGGPPDYVAVAIDGAGHNNVRRVAGEEYSNWLKGIAEECLAPKAERQPK